MGALCNKPSRSRSPDPFAQPGRTLGSSAPLTPKAATAPLPQKIRGPGSGHTLGGGGGGGSGGNGGDARGAAARAAEVGCVSFICLLFWWGKGGGGGGGMKMREGEYQEGEEGEEEEGEERARMCSRGNGLDVGKNCTLMCG